MSPFAVTMTVGKRELRPIVRAIVTSMVSPGLSSLAIGAMPLRQTIQPV